MERSKETERWREREREREREKEVERWGRINAGCGAKFV